jgi:dUTP pyrophosphatase
MADQVVNVNIQLLNEGNVVSTMNHIGDAGLDLVCLEDITVPAKSQGFMIKLGFKCSAFNQNGLGVSYLLLPRSSTGRDTPLRLSNSVGLIDSSYRGEICALVDNISDAEYTITKGRKLFQLLFLPVYNNLKINLCNELDNTTRGQGGFGSTGQ